MRDILFNTMNRRTYNYVRAHARQRAQYDVNACDLCYLAIRLEATCQLTNVSRIGTGDSMDATWPFIARMNIGEKHAHRG